MGARGDVLREGRRRLGRACRGRMSNANAGLPQTGVAAAHAAKGKEKAASMRK